MNDKQQQKTEQWLNEDRIALERLSQTDDGEAFLMQLLASTGIFETNDATDPITMAYAEGRRSVGIEILELLEQSRDNSAGRLLARMYGRAGHVMRMMFLRVNNHRKELEVLGNDEQQ